MNLFNEEKENSIYFLNYIYKQRKTIMLYVVCAVIASIVITFFIPKKYQSYAIIYPPNNHYQYDALKMHQFGYETDTEQLLQLLHSSTIRDSVVTHFDLITYYELDTTEVDWKDKIIKKFTRDITFSRTKYLSIVIGASTKNPELSASIVNYIVDAVNRFRPAIFQSNLRKETNYLEEVYKTYNEQLRTVTQRIYMLKDSTNANEIIENYIIRSSKQDYINDGFINSKEIADLIEEYKFLKQNYSNIKSRLAEANHLINKPFLDNYVIDRATPSYKKASPSYLLNLSVAFFGSLFLSIIYFSFYYRFSGLNKH